MRTRTAAAFSNFSRQLIFALHATSWNATVYFLFPIPNQRDITFQELNIVREGSKPGSVIATFSASLSRSGSQVSRCKLTSITCATRWSNFNWGSKTLAVRRDVWFQNLPSWKEAETRSRGKSYKSIKDEVTTTWKHRYTSIHSLNIVGKKRRFNDSFAAFILQNVSSCCSLHRHRSREK